MESAIVTRDPEIMSGTLCFAGTRVPVKNLFDYLAGSSSLEEFLEDFPSVSRDRAVAVLEAARRSLAAIAEVDAAWEVESAAESEPFLKVVAVNALKVPKRVKPSNYPQPFATQMEGRTRLSPGMCAGFKAGSGNGHRLVNETSETVVYLEVGDRSPGDEGIYPDDDLKAVLLDGQWTFQHKDGTPY